MRQDRICQQGVVILDREVAGRGGPVCPPCPVAVKIVVRQEGGHTGPPLRVDLYVENDDALIC